MKESHTKKELAVRYISSILAIIAFSFITYTILLTINNDSKKEGNKLLQKEGWEIIESKVCPVQFQLPKQDSYKPTKYREGSKYWVVEEQASNILQNSGSFYIGNLPNGKSKNDLGCDKGCLAETIIEITCIENDNRSVIEIIDSIERSYENKYNSNLQINSENISKWGFDGHKIELNINDPKLNDNKVLINNNNSTLIIEYYGNQTIIDEIMNTLIINQ